MDPRTRLYSAFLIALALIIVLAVAVFFRTFQIDRVPPPSLQVDEAFYGLDALHVMQGERAIFFEGNYGREPLFIYLAAGWFSLFGISPVTFRLLSGTIGTVTVLAMFWLGRETFWNDEGPANGIGLAAATFSAFLYVNVSFGRSAQRVIMFPLFVALVMAALARSLRTRRRRDYVLTGVLLGLSLYTYSAIRVLPIAVALAFVIWWVLERDRRFLVNGLLVATVAFIVFAPLGLYFFTHLDSFLFRASQTMTTDSLDVNLVRTLRLFVLRGDKDPTVNIPKRPMLDGIQLAFGLIGLAMGWTRRPRRAWMLALLTFAVMIIPPAISAGPAFGRTLGSVPPLLLFLGLGLAMPLNWVWRRASVPRGVPKVIAAGLTVVAVIALIGSIWITYRDYFLIYGHIGGLPYAFQENYTSMGNFARGLPADERILLSPFLEMPATLTFALRGDDPRITLYDGRTCVVLPDTHARSVSYLVILEDGNTLPMLLHYAPNGQATNTQHFMVYRVPAGTMIQPAPQHPVQARWAEPIELLGYDISQPSGDALQMVLYWRTLGQVAKPYTSFVHLLRTESGQTQPKLWAQHDAPPCNASYTTQHWQTGDIVADYASLKLPLDLPPGDYMLDVGLYDSYLHTRLAITWADQAYRDDILSVGMIHLGGAK